MIPSFRILGDFPSFRLLGFGGIFRRSVIPRLRLLGFGGIFRHSVIPRFHLLGFGVIFGSTDLDFKSARIVDLCGKSSGLADFENTVDRGSAVIFDADYGLCLS